MSCLVEVLTEDVVLRSDGGGKGVAVPNEVRGIDNVGRGILGVSRASCHGTWSASSLGSMASLALSTIKMASLIRCSQSRFEGIKFPRSSS